MNVGIIGTGYVGLVQGIVLADFGINVTCMDVDISKIDALKKRKIPIYEPGLKELLDKNISRLTFTTNFKKTIEKNQAIFIAVGTPPKDDGSAELKHVLSVASEIGKYMNNYKVVVNKSTVPIGTGRKVKNVIKSELNKRGASSILFDIVSNPEFLREGKAVGDCIRPDRVVVGLESERAKKVMDAVYRVLYINEIPFVYTNIETAEMIKYASNAFLAVKISFINELALLCEKVGANVQEVASAMGKDGRISPKFLHAGPGYGGSCFPKDTRALVDIGQKNNIDLKVVKASIEANEKQKRKMVEKIVSKMGTVQGKTIGVLGLSFKPETDDMREAPSIDIIEGLVKQGALIKAFCSEGIKEARWRLKHIEDHIVYGDNEYDACQSADGIVVVTEWRQFRGMDTKKIHELMNDNFLFDFRNIFVKDSNVRKLFRYFPVGRT